jgi:hypothetical protein
VTGSAAPERTQLAWTRTLLAGTVVALLTVRLALHNVLIATGAAMIWVLLVVLVHVRVRVLDRRPAGREPALLALVVVGYAVLAIALAVLP